MQNQLAEFKLGRIVLHLLCYCQDRNFLWHWRGIVREISQGALLISPTSPTSKCDATSCFENETEIDTCERSEGYNVILAELRPFSD
jgi:hypothetical protein